MQKFIALNDLRQKMNHYAEKVKSGESFIVLKRSKPLFKISPIEENQRWEEVIDFTKIKKGGVDIDEILKRL
ncbi:MAG: type II toxin-antitoxin system prevent-host-death family antitoxin [Candidatus Magasanikbacteria bacterium]|nr:type II toxin-antitoxin system prevent-host-death family antitoxin [Candidatus Magasanikbacteria bacterium]